MVPSYLNIDVEPSLGWLRKQGVLSFDSDDACRASNIVTNEIDAGSNCRWAAMQRRSVSAYHRQTTVVFIHGGLFGVVT